MGNLLTYRSTDLSIHPPIYPLNYISINSSIYQPINLPTYRSTDLSIHPPIYPLIYISIDSSIYRPIDLSIYQPIYPSTYLSNLYIYRLINLPTYQYNDL